MLIILLHPVSVGEITLASNDPRDYPVINGNYFADSRDIDSLYKGIEFALKLNDTLGYQNISAQVDLISVPECDSEFEKNSKDWLYCVLPIYANGVKVVRKYEIEETKKIFITVFSSSWNRINGNKFRKLCGG